MAGAYPDVPSNRMVYDRDGTQVYWINENNVVSQLSTADVTALNDESGSQISEGSGARGATVRLFFFFPELRDLAGYYFRCTGFGPASVDVEVSTNTTNGLDGTWTTISTYSTGDVVNGNPIAPDYRTAIITNARFGIRGLRFSGHIGGISDYNPIAAHLYGNITAGQNPDRLALWQPATDAHVTGPFFDEGNVPRGSSGDKTFRVKNLSSTLTAHNTVVALDALTDTTPSVPGQYLLSADGQNFTGTITLGDLPPGGLSPVLTLRRNTPSNATLSVWAARLLAQPGSWS